MLDLSSPDVKRFYRAATMHRAAAKVLLAACDPRSKDLLATEVIYLSGYVAECSLKALLLSRTTATKRTELVEDQFRSKRGHDLDWLKEQLHEVGVNMPRGAKEQHRRVWTVWRSDLRYDPTSRTREEAERVYQAAEGLHRWACGG